MGVGDIDWWRERGRERERGPGRDSGLVNTRDFIKCDFTGYAISSRLFQTLSLSLSLSLFFISLFLSLSLSLTLTLSHSL